MEVKISQHDVDTIIISSLSEICQVFWTPLLTNALTDVMKLVIARGNRCSADNAIQQPSLDRQGAANVLASLISTHNPYSNEKKKRDKLRNRGAVGRIFITYRPMTSEPVISLPRHGEGGGQVVIWVDSGTSVVLEFLSVFLSFFSEKHLTVTSSNIAFVIECTHFFQFSHSPTIISLNITYRSVFFF